MLEGKITGMDMHTLLSFFDCYHEIPIPLRVLDEDLAVAVVRRVRRVEAAKAKKSNALLDFVHTAHRRLYHVPWLFTELEQASLYIELDRRFLQGQKQKISS